MLSEVLAAIAPGLRDARSPLFSGALWALFGWIVLSDEIQDADTASGFQRQAYDLADAAGPLTTAIVATFLVFVVGVLSVEATKAASSAVAMLMEPIADRLEWNRAAITRIEERRRHHRQALERLETARQTHAEKGTESTKREFELKTRQAEKSADDLKKTERWIVPGVLVSRSAAGIKVRETRYARLDVCRQLVAGAIWRGSSGAVSAAGYRRADLEDALNDGGFHMPETVLSEIEADPLSVLNASDLGAFTRVDREAKERSMRLAICPPVLALVSIWAVEVSLWFIIAIPFIVTGFGVLSFSAKVDPVDHALASLSVTKYETNTLQLVRNRSAVKSMKGDDQ